ncbi:MAG: Uma2 family endonuclease [Cyanobacteria bacterium SBLK]|nr:Uma2 family endonuclease [Cyanobacteria bacterium SBLK]
MSVKIESLHEAYRGRDDYFAGGNMFLYFSRSQVKNKDFRGPDFFVVLDVDRTRERQGWVIWDEQGRYPDVISNIELPNND